MSMKWIVAADVCSANSISSFTLFTTERQLILIMVTLSSRDGWYGKACGFNVFDEEFAVKGNMISILN